MSDLFTNRRNILTVLGLGVPASALAIEDFRKLEFDRDNVKGLPGFLDGKELQARLAARLDALAAAIRNGEVNAISIEVKSDVSGDKWMSHAITINCELAIIPDVPVG